jgi:hypothetical protein
MDLLKQLSDALRSLGLLHSDIEEISGQIEANTAEHHAANEKKPTPQEVTAVLRRVARDSSASTSDCGVADFPILRFSKTEPFRLDIVLPNTGKTPAIKAREATSFAIRGDTNKLTAIPKLPLAFQPAGAIFPQGKFVIKLENTEVPKFYDGLIQGSVFLYFYGGRVLRRVQPGYTQD